LILCVSSPHGLRVEVNPRSVYVRLIIWEFCVEIE
jgi:hypothetical protein